MPDLFTIAEAASHGREKRARRRKLEVESRALKACGRLVLCVSMSGMDANAELTRLSKEVAELRAQMTELKQFLYVEERDELPGSPKILNIRCAILTFCNPVNPVQTQGMLCGSDEGPFLAMWGADEKTRALLRVMPAGAECRLYGKNLQQAVVLEVDEATGRGQVGVLEANKPRALLKASQTGAVVSVMHDDNVARAFLHADEKSGEFIAVNADVNTAVKITSDGIAGGAITVHGNDGKAMAAMVATHFGGLVGVNDEKGKLRVSMPSENDVGGKETTGPEN